MSDQSSSKVLYLILRSIRRVPEAILDVEERAVQIVSNTAEGADAARISAETGPLAGPLLSILGRDVPREGPLPEVSTPKPRMPTLFCGASGGRLPPT